jgi:hypothetical protein
MIRGRGIRLASSEKRLVLSDDGDHVAMTAISAISELHLLLSALRLKNHLFPKEMHDIWIRHIHG